MKVIINGIISVEDFIKSIDTLVKEKNIEYIDAVIHYCDKHNIELETAGAIIKKSAIMKNKVQLEAETLNFLPKSSRLPI